MNAVSKHRIFLSILFISIITCSTYTHADDSIQASMAQAAESNICDHLLAELLKVVDVIDYSLEHMAQVVNNNQVRNIEKKEVLPKIFELRRLVSQLKKNSIVITKENLAMLIQVTQHLLHHLETIIYSSLKEFPAFDPSKAIDRSRLKEYDFETLAEQIEKQSKQIKNLEKKAENVGLSLVNRAFRKLEHWNKDYKLSRRASIAAICAGIGAYLFYKMDPLVIFNPKHQEVPFNGIIDTPNSIENITKMAPGALHRPDLIVKNNYLSILAMTKALIGSAPGKDGQALIHGFGTSAQLSTMGLIAATTSPIIVFSDILKPYVTVWLKEQWTWIKEKRSEYASRLRGGPLKKVMGRFEKDPKITFDDVIGSQHAKSVLLPLVYYLLDYEKYDRSGIVPGTGYLFMGPPRTGKTYIAEALSGTIKKLERELGCQDKIRFLSFTAAELKEFGISELLHAAQELAPVIIFIDELDTGGFQREADARSLCQLMTAMSDLNKDKQRKVVLIGATNKPQNLDYALLQSGRFGTRIHFEYPTEQERKAFIKRELENRAIIIENDYIEKLAHQTKNCSFDALFQVITKALQRVKIRGTVLTEQDLDRAFDEEINHFIFEEEVTLPENEQHLVAIHQAGIAAARILLNTQEVLIKVTSMPVYLDIAEESVIHKYLKNQNKNEKESVQIDAIFKDQKTESIQYGKTITASPTDSLKYMTEEELIKEMKVALSGFVAERLINGSCAYIYNQEAKEHAMNIAKFITFKGMQARNLPKELREQRLKEAHELIERSEQELIKLFEEHQDALLNLANALHEEHVITADRAREILNQLAVDESEEEATQEASE